MVDGRWEGGSVRPIKLSKELIEIIFPYDKTHRCTKQKTGYCPIEGDETRYKHCLGTKELMEQYHKYRNGMLNESEHQVERVKHIFEGSSVVEVTYRGCCNSFYTEEGNTRLCIAKKTGTPIYAKMNFVFKCNECSHNDFYWSASLYRILKLALRFYIK